MYYAHHNQTTNSPNYEQWKIGCLSKHVITARKRSLRRLCFYRCLSVHRGPVWLLPGGACMVAMGGCAWLLPGGMCGCSGGGCMVAPGGCAWLLPGGGGVWLLRVGGGMHGIQPDTEIRSMSARYASYWNAFLLLIFPKHYTSAWPRTLLTTVHSIQKASIK